jgi:hypothetical protein
MAETSVKLVRNIPVYDIFCEKPIGKRWEEAEERRIRRKPVEGDSKK